MLNIQTVGTVNTPKPVNFRAGEDQRTQVPRITQPPMLNQDQMVRMMQEQKKKEKKQKAGRTLMTVLQVAALLSMVAIGIPAIKSLLGKGGTQAANEIGLKTEKDFARMFKNVSHEKSIEEMFLTPELENKMKEIKDKIARATLYNKMNLPQSVKAMLLYGPPGTGKNTFTYAITKFFPNARLFELDVAYLTSAYHGVTEQNIRNATNFVLKEADKLKAAGKSEKIIVFCDEVDRVMMQDSGNGAKLSNDVLTQFKKCFNDLKAHDNVVIIGATNKQIDAAKALAEGSGMLDDAMANRFGDKIEVVRPTANAIENAIKQRFANAEMIDKSLKDGCNELTTLAKTVQGDQHKFSYRTLQDNIFEKIVPPENGNLTVDHIIEAAIKSKDSIFLTKTEAQSLVDIVKDNKIKSDLQALVDLMK